MKKRLVIKTIIFIAVSIVLTGLYNAVDPYIASSLAMLQMYSTVDSSFWIQMYSYLNNHTYLVFIVFAILLYNKDIIKLINFTKEKIKNENTL